MKKQAEKNKLTALYERLSHDDERVGESVSIENQDGICQGYFHRKIIDGRSEDSGADRTSPLSG